MVPTSSTERARNPAAILTALVVGITWLVIGVSCVQQKRHADSVIRDSFDISAVQIQQLNGSVTSHVLVAITIGLAVTAVAAFTLFASGSRSAVAAFDVLDVLRAWDERNDDRTTGPSTPPRVRPLIVPPPVRAPGAAPRAPLAPPPIPPIED